MVVLEGMVVNLHEQNRLLEAQIELYQQRDTSHQRSHQLAEIKVKHQEEIIELKDEENQELRSDLKKEKGIRWGLIGLALLFLVI